jgi:short-subunit dehydrogenase
MLTVILLLVPIFAFAYVYKRYIRPSSIRLEKLRNKRVIITGASRGIGEELAYQCSRYQCRLVLAARSINTLRHKISDECLRLGARHVECIEFDASEEKNCIALIEQANAFYEGIDILILNHTASVYQPFFQDDHNINVRHMKHLFDVNFFGYFHSSKSLDNGTQHFCSRFELYFEQCAHFLIYYDRAHSKNQLTS